MLKSSKSSSNTSFNKKLRRRRFGGSGLSVWLVAGGTLLLPSEVWAFVVSGHVQTSGGAAVEGADISFDSGAEWGWASSGPDGSYSVNLPPDTYLLEVQPPHGSGLLPHSQSGVDVASDTTLDIVLAEPSPATYSGVLTDLSGAPIANARVEVVGNGEDVAGLTDASGAFSILTDTAAAMVQVSCDAYDDCSRFGANAYATWDLFIDLTGGSVTGAILEWPIYTLEGSVETSGSAPVADVPIAYYGSDHDYDTGQSFYVNFSGSADAQGLFSLSVTPGSGELRVTAPQGSGLLSALEDVFVSSADPSPVVVILEDALEYAGTLVDSHGTPIAGAWMTLQGGAFSYDGQTDETGAFSIQAGPDSDTISISCYGGDGCAHFGENAYAGLQDSVDLSAGSVTGAALVWPVRTLTGMVVDSQQAPVAGSNLSWNSNYYDEVTNQQITLSLSDQSTGADGAFSFLVSPGDGELNVTAPPASGLQNASMSVLVDGAVDPDPVTIALEPGVVYAGTLQDDAGNPIVGARVEVRDYDFSYYGTTDALGQFSVAASPQENDVDVTCDGYDGCTHFGASGSATLGGLSIDLSAGAILDAQLVWPVHELQCTVTDTDGLPVSDAYADWHSSGNDDATGVYYSNSDSQDTDADGKVTIRTSTGTGQLTIYSGSGSPYGVEPVVTGDASLSIVMQFAAEATSEVVSAGGAVSSDEEADGATPQDPIETLLVSALAGEVSLSEVPLSQAPPSGVRFLTQQISIDAPSSSPADPIQITFLLDASRVPEGFDHQSMDIYRNGTLVGDCIGASIASPDPCVTERSLVDEGDVRIVVLTSAASEWNFGVSESGPPVGCQSPADCDDSDACTIDTCNSGVCAHDASSDPACNPPQPECSVAGDCDDSDACTIDTCNSGVCAHDASSDPACNPPQPECSVAGDCDDGNTCTLDSCNSGVCAHQASSDPACNPPQPECSVASDCDDGNTCTLDSCVDGSCVNSTLASCGGGNTGGGDGDCVADTDCDDSNACTADACVSGACSHQALSSGSCSEVSDPPVGDEPVTPSDEVPDTVEPGVNDGTGNLSNIPRSGGSGSGCSLDGVGANGDAGSRPGMLLFLAGAALAITRRRRA